MRYDYRFMSQTRAIFTAQILHLQLDSQFTQLCSCQQAYVGVRGPAVCLSNLSCEKTGCPSRSTPRNPNLSVFPELQFNHFSVDSFHPREPSFPTVAMCCGSDRPVSDWPGTSGAYNGQKYFLQGSNESKQLTRRDT